MLETLSRPGRSGEDVGAGFGDIMSFYVPYRDAAIMRRRYNLSGVVTFVTWSTRMGRATTLLLLASAVSHACGTAQIIELQKPHDPVGSIRADNVGASRVFRVLFVCKYRLVVHVGLTRSSGKARLIVTHINRIG